MYEKYSTVPKFIFIQGLVYTEKIQLVLAYQLFLFSLLSTT